MESPECACCHCPEATVGAAAAKQNEPVFIGDHLTVRQALGRLSCAEHSHDEVYGTNYDTAPGEYLVWKLTECGLMAREVGWPSSWKLRCTSYFMRGKYWEKRSHSNQKLPDVVPPEGCEWKYSRTQDTTILVRRSQAGLFESVILPPDAMARDMFLACCEAAYPTKVATVTIDDEEGAVFSRMPALENGRYAVSFRRLPDGK